MAALTSAVWAVNPDQPIDGPWSIDSWVAQRTAGVSFLTQTAVVLSALGAFIAGSGVLGLTMHWIVAARRELAIRKALGASGGALAKWFGWRWLRVLSPAVAVGVGVQWTLLKVSAASIEGLRQATAGEVVGGVLVAIALSSIAAAWSAVTLRRVDATELVTR